MHRIIYRSTARNNLKPEDLLTILASARFRNPRHDITGMLLFDGDHFAQCLEGANDAAHRLMRDIAQDSRHHDVVVLHDTAVAQGERLFGGFFMGLLTPSPNSPGIPDLSAESQVEQDFLALVDQAVIDAI